VPGVVALVRANVDLEGPYLAHLCGGTVVGPSTVLTAAHCVRGLDASSIGILANVLDLCAPVPHESYVAVVGVDRLDGNVGGLDLAMLTLAAPLDRAVVRSIADEPGLPARAHALGWGAATPGGAGSCRLRGVTVEVRPAEACASAIGPSQRAFDAATMRCGMSVENGTDVCNGDSGGPLFLGDPYDGALIGVVSWATACDGSVATAYARPDTSLVP
jgi:trypsin